MVHNNHRLRNVSKVALYAYMHGRYKTQKRWVNATQALVIALVLVVSAVLQVYVQVKPPTYKLDNATKKLIGESRDDAKDYLKQDQKENVFNFALPKSDDKQAKEHSGRIADAYEATLPTNAKKGITYTDTKNKIGITVIPKFRTGDGKKVDGDHIVYPMDGQNLIYTLKYNGLKEDIVVPKYTANELDFRFELSLPSGVEARLDKKGNIGIYSSDPTLFGEISFGSDADRAKVDKARENGDKNNLVVTIPSPIVKDANGKEYNDKASFSLSEKRSEQRAESKEQSNLPAEVVAKLNSQTTKNAYTLTLASKNLKNLPYPISLDPTIQTLNASDFTNSNLEGGIDVDSSLNLIKRGSLTGGVLNSWTADTSITTARRFARMAVYNNYLYVVGGLTSTSDLSDVQYAKINNDGTLSGNTCGTSVTWCTTTSFTTGRERFGLTTYNGYMYLMGGQSQFPTSANYDGVQYAKIKTNGTLGTWSPTTALPDTIYDGIALSHNGFLYHMSGRKDGGGGSNFNTTYYAKFNANGSIGSWSTATNNFSGARYASSGAVYNGSLYIVGGCTGACTINNDVQYTKIMANGDLNIWNNTTTLPSGRVDHSIFTQNGYIYSTGGCGAFTTACSNPLSETAYAPIYADGSVGAWLTTTSITTARYHHQSIAYGNTIYTGTGCSTQTTIFDCTTFLADIRRTTINPAGTTLSAEPTQTNNFTTARTGHGTIVANGYIYVLGGCTVDQGSCTSNAVTLGSTYYASINSAGSISSWTAGTVFPTIATVAQTRGAIAATILENHIYVMGGSGNCGALGVYSNECAEVFYATIPANGGALSAWTTSGNPVPAASRRAAATSYNGYIYYTGGNTTTGLANKVYYATAGNGANGAWSTNTNNMTESLYLHAVHAYAGYIYVAGGYNGTINPLPVEYAQINANGSIGVFTNTSSMTGGRDGPSLFVHKGYLYVVGGYNGTPTYFSSIEYAVVNSDGTLGSFSTLPNGLSSGGRRLAGNGGVYNDRFYVAGGQITGGTIVNTSESIPINNGGSGIVDSWTDDIGGDFTTARGFHKTVAYNGYLYVIGGCSVTNCSTAGVQALDDVQYSPINSDGSVGSWTTSTFNMPGKRFLFGVATYKGYLYITGGNDDNIGPQTTVWRTQFQGSGDITTWTTETALPSIVDSHASVVYNNYLYAIGGTYGTSVYYIDINSSSGSLGPSWTLDGGTSYSVVRQTPGANVYKGFLYVIGGATSGGCSGTNELSSVEFAPLNNDGSVGTWTKTSSMPARIMYNGTIVNNGFMYSLGGCRAGVGQSTVFMAPILSNGHVGTWQHSTALSGTYDSGGVEVYNNYVYYTGSNGFINTKTRYAKLVSMPRIGSYSKLFDFDVGVKPTKLITRGAKQNGAVVSVNYSNNITCGATAFDQPQTITDTGYLGINAQTLSLGTSRTLARCLYMRYTIDDTLSAVFPDSGNETTITDFDIYFTANPGERLRGGRTFTNGTDRGLGVTP